MIRRISTYTPNYSKIRYYANKSIQIQISKESYYKTEHNLTKLNLGLIQEIPTTKSSDLRYFSEYLIIKKVNEIKKELYKLIG